jgi:NADP-dependent 3-hydroxy acid dehydrogenase YdfG
MIHFKNKVAVITDGNSGIGFSTAKELIERGAKVTTTGRRKDAVEKAASELKAGHYRRSEYFCHRIHFPEQRQLIQSH